MKKSFGNVKDTKLEDAILKKNFKELWNITKNDIKVCKDCEFRHMCTDCRAYIEDPKDRHSKPLKCGYDPYKCEWEDWSVNPHKQKVIKYFGV
jgi:SPASM domain peptide maturase of grasp-with-spasm system